MRKQLQSSLCFVQLTVYGMGEDQVKNALEQEKELGRACTLPLAIHDFRIGVEGNYLI